MANRKLNSFVALLRGINVGGKNIIPMKELKECFEDAGASDVKTYIQSGNVLFRSTSKSTKKWTGILEEALVKRFEYSAKVVVIEKSDFIKALTYAHKTWGKKEGFKHNAMFAIGGVDVEKILDELPAVKNTIETVSTGQGVIFWSASQDRLSATTMMKLSKTSAYKQLTVRNHKTTFKLAELLDET